MVKQVITMKACKIEICWMILTGLLAVYGIFITIIVLPYRGADYRALLFLTRCEKESAVVEYFGRAPEIVYHKGDVMTRLGWKLPSRRRTFIEVTSYPARTPLAIADLKPFSTAGMNSRGTLPPLTSSMN